jgi:hypothetical protein
MLPFMLILTAIAGSIHMFLPQDNLSVLISAIITGSLVDKISCQKQVDDYLGPNLKKS